MEALEIVHFSKICRTCLRETKDMQSVFDACLDQMLMDFAALKVICLHILENGF